MKIYAKYKNSGVEWIGDIPEGWEVIKMKYIGNFINGFPFKPTDWGERGRLIIRIQNLTEGQSVDNFYDGPIDDKYIIRNGDLLFSWSTTLGIYEWKKNEGLLNQHIFKVNLNSSITKGFYKSVSSSLIRFLETKSHGSTMTHLTKDAFGSVKLPLPPLKEQEQIVAYLDEKTSYIDNLLDISKRKIGLLKEQRASIINQVITKGLNPNAKMKHSGVEWIGDIPEGWGVSRFKYHSSTPVQYGLNISSEKYKETGIRMIRITDISDWGELNADNGKFLDEVEVPKEFLIKKYDVLFCRSGHTVGKSYLHLSDGLFTSGGYLVRFNFRNYVQSKFIFYNSKAQIFWDWLKTNTVVSTIENVNGDKYQNYIFPLPPLKEQEQIVAYLDEKTSIIDKSISIEERRIGLLKEYRQSIISQVITGKIKVIADE
jgi:type I restriction enzyme, S subunit